MSEPKYVPIAVRSPFRATTTEIDWADGHRSRFPHEILRGYCPCATCQGHSGIIRFVNTGDQSISTIETVGSYALQFTWGDGHNSGIYSFRYLRDLCWCDKCRPASEASQRPDRPRT